MKKGNRTLLGLMMGLALALAFSAGCQQQNSAEGTEFNAAARAELQRLREAHEAEVKGLQQQYNDVLRLREEALAKCRERNEQLEEDFLEVADLRDKLRTVKREINRLQKLLGTESETPQDN